MLHVHRRWAVMTLAACAVIAAASGCAAPASSGLGVPGAPGTPSASGSPTGSGDSTVVASDQSNGHTVSLKVGERLELTLASNYWTVRGSSVPRVLRQDGPSSLLKPPPGCNSIPGLGCIPIRTDFSAIAPGTAVITASRGSCGEAMRCPPSREHFALTVVVS